MNSDIEYWERMKKNAIKNNMPRVHGFWSGVIAAQQSVQLTALRSGLALSILFNVILLAVVAFINPEFYAIRFIISSVSGN